MTINGYVNTLQTILDSDLDFYEYMLVRYLNDTSVDLRSSWELQWRSIGFDFRQDSDLAQSAYVNVIKSVVDTLVNKLANQKVRPYFNPVNGLWKTKKTVRDVQQYFDLLYDKIDVHTIVAQAFKSACIMGKGYIYINPLNFSIQMLPAHCVATLSSEARYTTNPHKGAVRMLNFPVNRLEDYGLKKIETAKEYVNLLHYFDIDEKKQIVYLNGRKVKEEEYKASTLPFVTLYYNKPLFGNQTVSIVQELDGIQTQIDYINAQISAATQLSPANQTFVMEGSSLASRDLSNKAGMVYTVKLAPGQSVPPVISVTPRPFDPQWLELQKYYVQQAYEIVGVSQLSAMSKKPSGLDSGAALSTMEDIESDRFEMHVSQYVRAYVDLAKLLIDILPENEDILPPSSNTSSMQWKDIKEQSDLFKVQYSAATSLSKDPAEKIKQIISLNQAGLITADKIASYLDMPDLEDAYKDASAIHDGIMQCIERAIEDEDYEVPDWVGYQQLAKQITIVENELYSSVSGDEENDAQVKESLSRIRKLEENLASKMEENGFVELEPQTEATTAEDGSGITSGIDNTQVADITSEIDNPQETYQDDLANNPEVTENGESLESE